VVLGTVLVALWPTFVGTDTSVQALTGTDVATTTLQSLWTPALMIGGLAVVVAIIYFAVKKFKAGR